MTAARVANGDIPVAQERFERRLAAILAADMVGYSRHMEADEEGTIARLKGLSLLPCSARSRCNGPYLRRV